MSSNSSENSKGWPLPNYRFKVDWGDIVQNILFQEVSGLDSEIQLIEYRKGDSPDFGQVKMPGIAKYGNVTLKRGVFLNSGSFWKLYDELKLNTIKRQTVTIKLIDEIGKVVITWTLINAWPTKISSTDLKSDGNQVAIDSIELAYQELTISNQADR